MYQKRKKIPLGRNNRITFRIIELHLKSKYNREKD